MMTVTFYAPTILSRRVQDQVKQCGGWFECNPYAMFYGGDSHEQGAPPPVVFLTGYGDYVFDKVPVVITTFTVDMPDQVDYISTVVHPGDGKKLEGRRSLTSDGVQPGQFYGHEKLKDNFYTWAPTQSLISITCQPIYSRSQVAEFSLEKFVNGAYVGKNSTGFI